MVMSCRNSIEHSDAKPSPNSVFSTFRLLVAWARELGLYTCVGGFVFLFDVASYYILFNVVGIWFMYAHFVSRTMGGLACFFLNRFVTFRHTKSENIVKEFCKFAALYLGSFIMSSSLIYSAVHFLAVQELAAKIAAECIVFLLNYSIMKYWVMNGGKHNERT